MFLLCLQRKGILVKWKGYPKWECTFEPRRHLNAACLKELEQPRKPSPERLQDAANKLLSEVQKKLANCRKSNGLIRVEFDLDIYRWVFQNQKKLANDWILCERKDFDRLDLPEGWDSREDKFGEAVSIVFPVRVKGTLRCQKSSRKFGLGFPLERLHVYFVTQGQKTE